LGHERDLSAQRQHVELAYIAPVVADGAVIGVGEAVEQAKQR
jgi:hypothetical protein